MPHYTVYYWKDSDVMLKLFLTGKKPTLESLMDTHSKVGDFNALDKEELFYSLQSANMSRSIQAHFQKILPSHISLTTGDIIREGSNYFIYDACDFARIF